MGCNNGWGGSCLWILIIIVLFFCCGNGCGNNGVWTANNCGNGCGNNCGC